MKLLTLNKQGWIEQAQHIVSPNFDARPEHCNIEMLVIHNISLPPCQYGGQGIVELFTNQLNPNEHPYYAEIYTRKVSSHFLIRRDGTLIQFVSCLDCAWHAGVSQWLGRERCNDFSVGIELEGSDFEIFESVQYTMLIQLVATLKKHYPIEHIVGHSEIAPGRKTDPGPFFDWNQLQITQMNHTHKKPS
ncbi:MAG TPA: 1,6-anhydro-N-acetylmuramyl-L-alanine amidase AmpD [Methylophilaceae bacterium]|nr:1,6-anhydro-N-acetylmuramyl-L-alanine amidase AmpD [Methylophilaceae bacterium]HAJ72157.1 1,6-anhydro-N-acetylmuramyl-L-alanine amidase AmpD [Methylophilaceae bacterium]